MPDEQGKATEEMSTPSTDGSVTESVESPEEGLIFEHPEDDPEDKAEIAKLKGEDVPNPDGEGEPSEADSGSKKGGQEPTTPKEDDQPPDGWKQPETFQVYGRQVPADKFRIIGENAERVFNYAQKGLAADVALAQVAERQKALDVFEPIIRRLKEDKGFREHVLAGWKGGAKPTAPEDAPTPGPVDQELEDGLQNSPTVKRILEENARLRERLGEQDATVGPLAQEQQAKRLIDATTDEIVAMGYPAEEFAASFPFMHHVYQQLAASPDPTDRARAERLDNDPAAWKEFFLHNKARGVVFAKKTPAASQKPAAPRDRGVVTKPASKEPLPRDVSRQPPAGGGDDWSDAIQRAAETGDPDDLEAAIALQLGE